MWLDALEDDGTVEGVLEPLRGIASLTMDGGHENEMGFIDVGWLSLPSLRGMSFFPTQVSDGSY